MPRLPRIRVEGAVYYITSKAVQNEQIFKDRDDYKMYLDLVTKYKDQHKFRLYSYCLLPDRLEMLIETGDDASISEIMHDLNSLYTKYFNGRYHKRGHLFEARFRSVLVEKALFLASLTRHIHQAPWRHASTYSQPIQDYPYSSFHVYVRGGATDGGSPEMRQEISEILQFLREKDNTASYEKYVLEGDKKEIEFLEKSLRRGQVLGSDAFQEKVKTEVARHATEIKKEPASGAPNKLFVFLVGGLVVVATATSVHLYISRKELESKYRSLVIEKEERFARMSRFENQSPLVRTELEGSIWQVEMLAMDSAKSKETLTDRIFFVNGRVHSEELLKKGFQPTNYTVTPSLNGMTSWETVQTNDQGDTVSWRGDWQGDAMKGIVHFAPASGPARDFSFYSLNWAYAEMEAS